MPARCHDRARRRPPVRALDLCVECKACKSECPTGVDMAKLKYEVLAQHNDAQGTPLRARVFAIIRILKPAGSPLRGFANLAADAGPPVRSQRFARHPAERPLPAFASPGPSPLDQAWRRPAGQAVTVASGAFPRRHSRTTNHPEVGQAAVRSWKLGRCRSVASGLLRPSGISKGLLAKPDGREDGCLRSSATRGVPIVGTEPSCLLTFRDEYPDLLRRRRPTTWRRHPSAGRAHRWRQEDAASAGKARSSGRRVLLHAHCHQKAMAAAGHALLRSCPATKSRWWNRLLRHGRLFRLRGGALRALQAHRQHSPLPRSPGRSGRHGRRDDRGVLPSADSARDRAAGPASPRRWSGRRCAARRQLRVVRVRRQGLEPGPADRQGQHDGADTDRRLSPLAVHRFG